MISAQELTDPITPLLRVIEERARAAQQDGQQFICLTSIDGYIISKERCNKILVNHGYTLAHGCMCWGKFAEAMKKAEDIPA